MNFILYIKATDQQDFNYANPFLESLEVNKANADFLDLDNFSGADLLEAAFKALESADKCCVILDIHTQQSFSNFYKIVYYLVDNPSKCLVFLQGEQPALEKILCTQAEIFNLNLSADSVRNKIVSFLK